MSADKLLLHAKWPNARELEQLPRWALVVFAARCARRLNSAGSLPSAVLLAERSAAKARAEDLESAIREASQRADEAYSEVSGAGDESDWAYEDSAPFEAAKYSAQAAQSSDEALHFTYLALGRLEYVHTYSKIVNQEVWKDYELLRDLAITDSWGDNSPVSPEIFALHSRFVDADVSQFDLEVRPEIDAKLIEYFARYPDRLYSITPRQFEELIGELLTSFDYRVELTKRTRDGGRDIVAISSTPIRVKLLVECKRYAPHRSVGIAPVQRLHGVCCADGATKGLLVTTSWRFSRPAERFLKEQEWLIEGRAFNGLVDWLSHYQQFQIERLRNAQRGSTWS